MKRRVLACLGTMLWFSTPTAFASSDYPSKPIRLIVGYSAGGSVDIVAREFAQRAATILGQPVIVENRAGASGAVAAQAIANARPDGYSIYFVASPTLTITPAIQRTSFDPLKDFTEIGTVVNYFNVLMVQADSPYKNVGDLIDAARRKPGEVTYGSAGIGAANHISGELLADGAGVKMTHVPYNGNAPAMMSLMSGQISFAFDVNNTAKNTINSGKLRALAVTSREPHAAFPGVPTLIDSGYKDVEFTGWFGLVGPAGLSPAVVKTLSNATQEIVQSESFQLKMIDSGYALPSSDNVPEALRKRIERDVRLFADLAERSGLRAK